jgi:hypothetical protein
MAAAAFGNSFGLPIEILRENVIEHLSHTDIFTFLQVFPDVTEELIPGLIRKFLKKYPYESLVWDEYDGTVADFVSKLRMTSKIDDGLILAKMSSKEGFSPVLTRSELSFLFTQEEIIDEEIIDSCDVVREFELYVKLFLKAGFSIESAFDHIDWFGRCPRSIKILLKLAQKYPHIVVYHPNDNGRLVERCFRFSDEEFNELFEKVDSLVSIGAKPLDALDVMVFRKKYVDFFISDLKKGVSSNVAFDRINLAVNGTFH